MKLKSNCFLLIGLIIVIIGLNACSIEQNQPIISQSLSSTSASHTSVPVTSTLTPTLSPTITETLNPTATPTFLYPMPTFLPDCGTVKLGNSGTQTIDNLENIIIQGVAILCGDIYVAPGIYPQTLTVVEGMIDLDTGTFDSESADIRFCPGGGTMIFYGFCDMNNAFVRVYSLNGLTMKHAKEPMFDECQSITAPYGNDHDNEPEYACVITNLGNISRIKVEEYNPLGKNVMSLEISFVTWKK